MHRLFTVAAVSATAALQALTLAGGPLSSIAWIVPVTTSLCLFVWFGTTLILDLTYRTRADADAMMNGVCPECRTFNSLQEVTSADPEQRRVDCLACKESYRVRMTPNGIAAERLGKLDESE